MSSILMSFLSSRCYFICRSRLFPAVTSAGQDVCQWRRKAVFDRRRWGDVFSVCALAELAL